MHLSGATGTYYRRAAAAWDAHAGGDKVWHLRLTIHFLADAGNMLDCACLAGIAALKHFRRPDVEVIGDEVIVVRTPHAHPSHLSLT